MTSKWNTSSNPRAATSGQTWAAGLGYLINGIDTVATDYAGATDPSTAAPVAWDLPEVGTTWLDTTNAAYPVVKRWCQLTATPTYGWRALRYRKVKFLDTPQAVTFSPASPALADVTWTDVDLAATLNTAGCQDAGQVAALVAEVLLYVTYTPATTETITDATKGHIAFRAKGSGQEYRVTGQVAGRPNTMQVWVPLSSAEILQFQVIVGTGTPSSAYSASIAAIHELA